MAANPIRRLTLTAEEMRAILPADLVNLSQWVAWGNDKGPINPRNGSGAKANDPSTWGSFEQAFTFHEANPRSNGVGFEFASPYAGVDLDHCVDPATGTIEPWARSIVDDLASFSEFSPSDTGIHTIVRTRTQLPSGLKFGGYPEDGKAVEMYCGKRYFTVTGNRVPGTPATVEDRTEAFVGLHARLLAERERRKLGTQAIGRPRAMNESPDPPVNQASPQVASVSPTPSDEEVLRRAQAAANGDAFKALYRGEWQGSHRSTSEADAALCAMLSFWCGRNGRDQVDRLFRQSGLMRDKWEREDYRKRTLDLAYRRTEFHGEPSRKDKEDQGGGQAGNGEGHQAAGVNAGNLDAVVEAGRQRLSETAIAGLDPTRPAWAFEKDSVFALAVLHAHAPADYGKAKALLAEKFGRRLSLRDLDSAIKAEADSVPAKESGDESECKEAGELAVAFPDAGLPQRLRMPFGYQVTEDGRVLDAPPSSEGTVVAEAPVFLAARSVDVADGSESLTLVWRRAGEWRSILAPRSQIMDRAGIIALAATGFPVHSGNATLLIEYLARFEAVNLGSLPVGRVSSSLGRLSRGEETHGFLCGAEFIPIRSGFPTVAFRGTDTGEEQIVRSIQRRGSIEGWRQAVGLASPYPRAIVAVAAGLAPVLLRLLRQPNFAIDWAWPTSTGKTTVLRLAASSWGVPDERSPESYILTWSTTAVHLERRAALLSCLPLCIDDSKQAKRAEDVPRVVYDVVSGHGKGRGSRDGLRRTGTWHTVMLSTGEAPLTAFSNDGGTKARVIEVRGLPFSAADAPAAAIVAEINRIVRLNHGHAGPAFVRWLASHFGDVEVWRATHEKLLGEYLVRAGANAVAGRFGSYFAVLHATADLARLALDLPWDDPAASLDALWADALRGAAEADTATEALRWVLSWAHASEQTFWGRHSVRRDKDGNVEAPLLPPGGWSGRWDPHPGWEWIGFLERALRRALAEGEHDWFVVEAWRQRGWLRCDPGRSTLRVRMGEADERPHLIAIDRRAIRLVAPDTPGEVP